MIIYRYLTSTPMMEVHQILTEKDNKMRVKIGLNTGYEQGKGWMHDYGWPTYVNGDKHYPEPKMEYMIKEKPSHNANYNKTEIQIAFYYNVLINDVDTTISRSLWRIKLIEKLLAKYCRDFTRIPEVLN